jgi:LmbE family N-acetylglucosaminyl deacetylase
MDRGLTIMAVHAHPDDEVFSTGGTFARYAAEGIQTVLVTCTNGEQGDGPGGVKPGTDGHDQDAVAALRLRELQDSVAHLGVAHLELLGYRDSGMEGWAANHASDAFANVPFDEATAKLADLMRRYRPQVVVTYDETGGSGYNHPDHVQAHRIAVAAIEQTGIPSKFYYTAVPRSGIKVMFEYMKEHGIDTDFEVPEDFGTPDEEITAVLDVSPYAERKRKALEAHASQGANIFVLNMPDEVRHRVLATETFIRQFSKVAAPDKEDDLFAGLR